MRMIAAILAAMTVTPFVAASDAQAASQTGHVIKVTTAGATNAGFRVFLDTSLASCAGTFVYTDSSDSNYQVWVASLMAAYYAVKTLNITYLVEGTGYCRIQQFDVF